MRTVSVLGGTVVHVGGSQFGIILVFTWFLVGLEVALSMDIVFGMPFSSMVMMWIFTSITPNGPVVHDSSLLNRIEVFLPSAIKPSGERFT